MIQRTLAEALIKRFDYKKAILILGPRQVGKTKLVKEVLKKTSKEFILFNGDQVITRDLWKNEQIELLRQSFGNKKIVVLDEAQMIEDVGIICKQLIDAEMSIQFILTGSSALNIANLTQEPLTGRKWEYFLFPISCNELIGYTDLPIFLSRLSQYLVFGTYPEVVTDMNNAPQILNNLCSSHLYKDVLALTGIKKPQLLEKILKALAWQVGSEVSLNELSRLTGADAKTIESYIYLLEQVFVIYRLGAYSGNLRNEINRKKKIYFYDNGIRNALIGNYAVPDNRNDMGALWENFLITERKKLLSYHGFYGYTYFWRNKAQAEIDYIEEINGKLYAYEFKWNPSTRKRFSKSFTGAYHPVETRLIHRENFREWLRDYPY